MTYINRETFQNLIKKEREQYFLPPYDLVYNCFTELGFDKKDPAYFENNASTMIELLRQKCWEKFLISEKAFTSEMLKRLIDVSAIKHMNSIDAITWFAETFPDHIYSLNLSNTQSRRSRAGKEFECIIELLLIGADIPMDSQGNIGKEHFIKKGLGKLVDSVSPGVVEYVINKRNTVLISAKTTLRERWQEVPEEMGRTGAREMFLATLDETISDDVLKTLYEANIQVTTTKRIKETYYPGNDRVLDFEKLIRICKDNNLNWENYHYTKEQSEQIIQLLQKQMNKHKHHSFVKDSYKKRLNAYALRIQDAISSP